MEQPVGRQRSITFLVTLLIFLVSLSGCFHNSGNGEATIEGTTLQKVLVKPNPLRVRVNGAVKLKVYGIYSNGEEKLLDISKVDFLISDTTLLMVEGSGKSQGLQTGQTTLRAKVGGIVSMPVDVSVGRELNTSNFHFTDFGSTYTDLIPFDSTLESYDSKRFSLLTGTLYDEAKEPLSGATVRIYKHPEYGSVQTDEKGLYVLPVEGGKRYTVRYQKEGYASIDRGVDATAHEWVHIDDIMMMQYDQEVTVIDLNQSQVQLHRSSTVDDERGARATTLIFDGVRHAVVHAPDGSTRELTHMAVRATEFKTPESMPSDLPQESAYTYCSDLTVDGVREDENITFDAPVVMYVENFLGFDTGAIVPVGYYDRNAGEWKASDNGVVVTLLDMDNDGKVDALDATGDGNPDDLNGNGDPSDEVAGIAERAEYTAGSSYWRAEITHFTPWDHNWPYGPPADAAKPKNPEASPESKQPGDCQRHVNSYVTQKTRVFHEDIPVAGTDITLHYASDRVEGYIYMIDASVDTSEAPSSVKGAVVSLDIAGRHFEQEVTLGELAHLYFEWDGKDAVGRKVTGEVKGTLKVTYTYALVYYDASSAFSSAWARAGTSATDILGRNAIAMSSVKRVIVNTNPQIDQNTHVANGWSLSSVHTMGTNAIYKGDGTTLEKTAALKDGLVAYYRFEGNAKDSSGNGLDGSVNGVLQYDEGMIGKAAYFDGTQHIKTPVELIGIPENQYLTIAFWGKAENEQHDIFVSNYNTGDGMNSVLMSASSIGITGRFGGYWWNGYCYKYTTVNLLHITQDTVDACGNHVRYDSIYDNGINPIDITKWHHYALTYDNQYERIYIDGVEVFKKELEANMIGGSNMVPNSAYYRDDNDYDRYLNIGQQNNAFNYSYNHLASEMLQGAIDDLRIYRKVLTSEKINQLYNQGVFGQSNYVVNGFNISDHNLEYQFNLNGKHLSTKAYPSHKILETYTYDDSDYVTAITDRFGEVTRIERDYRGYPAKITAPNGQVTTLSVDDNGDLVEVGYEDNSKYTFSYFDGSLMDTMRDPNGNLISHVWNDNGRIIEEVDGLGGSYHFLRNVTGTETFYSTILPEGETSTSSDTRLTNGDTLSTMTLPTGESVTATFAKDESKTMIQRDGVTTAYTYTSDPLTHQRILSAKEITQPSGLTQTTAYSVAYDGNETHTNSKTQTISLNSKDTVRHIDYNTGTDTLTTPEGRVAKRLYDIDTLLTQSISSGTLIPTTYTYDAKGRLTKACRVGIPAHRCEEYTYDVHGNVATLTDSKGQTTHYSYDIVDRLTEITYPNGAKEHFTYDNNGNLLTRIVPTSATHSFTYNGGDLRSGYTSALNKATTYRYDKSKHLTQIIRPSGKTIDYSYTDGRLEKITTPESTIDYSYLFADKAGSLTKGSEKIEYTYDGTLPTAIAYSGTLNQSIGYSYDNDFKVTGTTYAGETENYTYDNDGLLTRSGRYTLTRDSQNGYVTELTDGTLTQNRSYNNFGEITEVSDNTFAYTLTQRDGSGAITQKQERIGGTTITYDYTYDERGRLTKACRVGIPAHQGCEEYTYDANGNRLSATINGTTTTASYTLDDQLEVYGNNSYRYDDDGYLIEKTTPEGTATYSYNTMGALTDVTLPDGTQIHYITDPLNRRIAKEVNGTITEKYLWEDLTTLLAVYDKDDNLIWRFEYADGRMPVSMTDNTGNRYYLHYDQVGSLRTVSNTDHNIVKEIVYDTFGNILSDSNPSLKVPFGFAGGLYDPDTKLTHFGFREYDAYTGKWTAKDPLLFGGGDSNLYGYVLNDPVNWIDPEGLFVWAIPWAIVEAAGWAGLSTGTIWAIWNAWNNNPTWNFPATTNGGEVCYSGSFPDTPSTNPENYQKDGKKGLKNKNDGSYWEKDTSNHGGEQWKRWPNRKAREKGRKPNSVWPDGRIRK